MKDGYFFGDSDTILVVNPSDSDERKVLALTESFEQGLSQPLTTGLLPADFLLDKKEHHDMGILHQNLPNIQLNQTAQSISSAL